VTFASVAAPLADFLIFFPTFRFVFTKSTPPVVPFLNDVVRPVDCRFSFLLSFWLLFLELLLFAAFAAAFFGLYRGISLQFLFGGGLSPHPILSLSLSLF
jgi:hypothetical protein|tara:strand:- start:38 stop:337 length:300 start_codon:yes stop_codon:yes gene_type:complete